MGKRNERASESKMTTVRLAIEGHEHRDFKNPELKPGLLVSYYYLLKNQFEMRSNIFYRDWVLDSGAFSAYNSDAVIDLKDYIEVCKELKKSDSTLAEIFALDVIGDHVASLKNTEIMWSEGVEAIPCYHLNEPWSILDHLAKNYPKIALGGVAMLRGKKKAEWAKYCVGRIWPKKVHGFGFGSETSIMLIPFHSVDATNWKSAQRFGHWLSKGGAYIPVRKHTSQGINLENEIEYFLDLENRAKHRWEKEMKELAAL